MIAMPCLNLEAWLIELQDDTDKDFLVVCITDGFDIVNSEALVVPVEVKNNPSASPGSKCYELVLSEILEGTFMSFCDRTPPDLLSPLGGHQKNLPGVCVLSMVVTCSRPAEYSLNDFVIC